MVKRVVLDCQKILKKRGNSVVISLSKENMRTSQLKEGDIVNVILEVE